MLFHADHRDIYPVKQFSDKVLCSERFILNIHGLPPCWCLNIPSLGRPWAFWQLAPLVSSP
jgi:hypothetical protein